MSHYVLYKLRTILHMHSNRLTIPLLWQNMRKSHVDTPGHSLKQYQHNYNTQHTQSKYTEHVQCMHTYTNMAFITIQYVLHFPQSIVHNQHHIICTYVCTYVLDLNQHHICTVHYVLDLLHSTITQYICSLTTHFAIICDIEKVGYSALPQNPTLNFHQIKTKRTGS